MAALTAAWGNDYNTNTFGSFGGQSGYGGYEQQGYGASSSRGRGGYEVEFDNGAYERHHPGVGRSKSYSDYSKERQQYGGSWGGYDSGAYDQSGYGGY